MQNKTFIATKCCSFSFYTRMRINWNKNITNTRKKEHKKKRNDSGKKMLIVVGVSDIRSTNAQSIILLTVQ